MDLNYLYHRHQISLMHARRATSKSARFSHLGLARGYAQMIEAARDQDLKGWPAPLSETSARPE